MQLEQKMQRVYLVSAFFLSAELVWHANVCAVH
jgi:hypothetical protein